jgi:hypothetical protein
MGPLTVQGWSWTRDYGSLPVPETTANGGPRGWIGSLSGGNQMTIDPVKDVLNLHLRSTFRIIMNKRPLGRLWFR